MTRAPLSTAQRIAAASASGEIVPSERTIFATSSAREADAGDPLAIVQRRGDLARDERAVAVRVVLPRAGDEALAVHDPALELRMGRVDAGVEDGDADAREIRNLRPRVEGVDPAQVPLTDGQRVVRREHESARRPDPLDPGDAGHR